MLKQNVLILTTDPNLPTLKGLRNYLDKVNINVDFLNPFKDISLSDSTELTKNRNIFILPRTSGVLFDDIDLHLCEAWSAQGAHCLIPVESIAKLRDKDRQYLLLKAAGLPMLETLIHRGPLNSAALSVLNASNDEWILKSIRGNKGIGVERYTTAELISFWKKAITNNDQRYLIQEFLNEARELRILCLGNKLYAIEKINEANQWKKNAQYAKFEKAQLSDEERKEFLGHAQIIKEELELACFAIDLIANQRNERWEVLEVNVHPGLEASQQALKDDLYQVYWEALTKNSPVSPRELSF